MYCRILQFNFVFFSFSDRAPKVAECAQDVLTRSQLCKTETTYMHGAYPCRLGMVCRILPLFFLFFSFSDRAPKMAECVQDVLTRSQANKGKQHTLFHRSLPVSDRDMYACILHKASSFLMFVLCRTAGQRWQSACKTSSRDRRCARGGHIVCMPQLS